MEWLGLKPMPMENGGIVGRGFSLLFQGASSEPQFIVGTSYGSDIVLIINFSIGQIHLFYMCTVVHFGK